MTTTAKHLLSEIVAGLDGVTLPVPRGGIEPDWHAAAIIMRRKFRKLEKAARSVIEEADRIHDNEPWPLKYRAPYEAITALRKLLAEIGSPDVRTKAQPHSETRQEQSNGNDDA